MKAHFTSLLLVAATTIVAGALSGFDDADNFTAAVDEFQQWFAANYHGPVKVRLGEAGEGMRVGVFALERLPAESKYLSIPMEMIIGEEKIFGTPVIGPALRRLQRQLPMDRFQATLAVFLIYERFVAGGSSFFHPYIRLLPREHDTPMFYNDAELGMLSGTLIPDRVRQLRAQQRRDFANMRQRVFVPERELFPPHTFNLPHWEWAMGILNTRMIWWDGAPHLVPMLDMINCRQGPANPRRVHSTRRGPQNRADTLAPWTFERGEQVFENYGQPNPTYFLYHGFVMQPNVHDCGQVRLLFGALEGTRNMQKVRELRLWREEYCVTATKFDDALAAARVAVASEQVLNRLRAVPSTRINTANERRALKLVGDSIRTQLEAFQPVSKDAEVPEGKAFRMRMIAAFLESQRTMLNETLGVLRAQARSLRAKMRDPGKKPPLPPRGAPSDEL